MEYKLPRFKVKDLKTKEILGLRVLQYDSYKKGNKLVNIMADNGSDKSTIAFTNLKSAHKIKNKNKDIIVRPFEEAEIILEEEIRMMDEINDKLKEGDSVVFNELVGGDGFVGSSAWKSHKGVIKKKNNELFFQNKDMVFLVKDGNGEIYKLENTK